MKNFNCISIKHRILATFNIKKNQSERLYAFKAMQELFFILFPQYNILFPQLLFCSHKKDIVFPQHTCTILFRQHIILFPQYIILFPQHIILFPQYNIINTS